jgi:N-acetyltransferase
MKVEPVRLAGETVRLEPLTLDHAPRLFRSTDPAIFEWFVDWPRDATFESYVEWERHALERPASLFFAIVLRAGDEPVGATGYLDVRPEHRALEIGRTWIARRWQGTRVNPESKLLLLRHAFGALGAVRVQLKTDLRNLHSQRALDKLGARREGVLRKYQTRSDGRPRDSVMYSITDDDWPAVEAALIARLAATPA